MPLKTKKPNVKETITHQRAMRNLVFMVIQAVSEILICPGFFFCLFFVFAFAFVSLLITR